MTENISERLLSPQSYQSMGSDPEDSAAMEHHGQEGAMAEAVGGDEEAPSRPLHPDGDTPYASTPALSSKRRRTPLAAATAASAPYLAIVAGILLLLSAGLFVAALVLFLVRLGGSGGKYDVDRLGYVCREGQSAVRGDPCVEVVSFSEAAVAADSALCSEMGVKVMKQYAGNAVDAAVTVALCLGLTHPFSSGIGGGHGMLIHLPNADAGTDTPVHTINAREKAPLFAHKDMFNDDPMLAQVGGLAIAVPGEISGLHEAWRRHGSLEWSKLFEDVIHVAENGHPVNRMLAKQLVKHKDKIMERGEFKTVFAPGGTLLQEGQMVKYSKLAKTLRAIADKGSGAFYNAATHTLAANIVADVRDAGGNITAEDLMLFDSEYSTDPLITRHNGMQVYGARPPFSGGPCVLMMLNLLETFDLSRLGPLNYETIHAMLEASKFAFGHRMVLGDPKFVNTTEEVVDKMVDKNYADLLRRAIDYNGGTLDDPKHYGYKNKLSMTAETHGTTHFSVVDGNGMAVALTSTINLEFGSFVMGSRTGIIFNDEMDDFSIPNKENAFHIPPSKENFIMPGKRPLSSMSPTIVTKNGRFHVAIGASGGSRIITATLHAIVNSLHLEPSFGVSIAKSRFHHQLLPDDLWIETERAFHENEQLLEQVTDVYKNYTMKPPGDYIAVVQGILVDEENDIRQAVSDWRKHGRADGF